MTAVDDWRFTARFGEVIGISDGVVAHSNAFSTFDSGEEASLRTNDGEVYTGVKWMCVEFARRFWFVKYGVTFGSVETAADMWAETKSAGKPNGESRGVVPRENGGSTKPRRGDLLIYDRAERDFLGAGHVAVIVEVKEKRIKVAEQNWDNRPWQLERSARYLTLTEEGGAYRITDENPMPDGGEPLGEEVIRGWLRLE